jgi:hypothetical protein
MNVSTILRRFLDSGKRPSSQREVSALLDESRSLLVSKLPSTAVHIQNLTQGDIDDIVAGGKDGMIDRAVAIHRAQNLSAPRPSASPARPAAKAHPAASVKPSPARPAAAPAPKPPAAIKPPAAPRLKESTDILMCAVKCSRLSEAERAAARAELQLRGYFELPSGAFSKSQ